MANRLTVTSVEAANNRLTISFSCKGQIQNYFTQNQFLVEYNASIEGVPEAILIIPFLASICPIAWANQADVYVEEADKTFLCSLGHVQKTLQKFYPQMKFSGRIYAQKIVTVDTGVQTKSMTLFSGGIDGLTTYFRHKAENPILVSIHGFDIALNKKREWNRFVKQVQTFSTKNDAPFRTIRFNSQQIIDWFLFIEYFPKISGYWEERVMHGLALLGLCAPLTYIDKVRKLYIASSFTDRVQFPWGSHPEIDNHIKWNGTRAIHDGYELSRQEKINFLVDYFENINPDHHIRTCNATKSDKNCSICEKCSRTILGLELAGINPSKHGFNVDSNTFLNIKRNLTDRRWRFGDDEEFMWTDLQQHASLAKELPHPEARVLVDWLLQANFKTLRTPQPRAPRLIPFFKYLPHPIYRIAKRTYIISNNLLLSMKLS